MIQILYKIFLFSGLAFLLITSLYIWFYKKKIVYTFSSLNIVSNFYFSYKHISVYIIFFLRFLTLLSLIFAFSRFRIPNEISKLPIDGVDIIMALDVSGSMMLYDKPVEGQNRFDIVKKEALKFIDKRPNDQIGVVLFANQIISRCPLTFDKNILKTILAESEVGIVDPSGTRLSHAVVTALARLKNSISKSKVIILLTDGQPSNDIDYNLAIDMAKKMGVKIYSIGIGSKGICYQNHPYFGFQDMIDPGFNEGLLKLFADQTGGQFFSASKTEELEDIYSKIDLLEKTENTTPNYANYFEYFMYFLFLALGLLCLEILLSSFIWRSI